MTEREAAIPRPFGYIRDNNGEMRVFQHKPFTEVESICYSTAPVYSHAQMLEVWQASRQQAVEEAARTLGTALSAILDTWRVSGMVDELSARRCYESVIRSLTPTKGPTP